MRRLELQEAQDIWKLAKLHTNTHQSKAHSADVHKAKAKKKTQFRSPHGQEESEWVCDGPHLSFQLIFFFFFLCFVLSLLPQGPKAAVPAWTTSDLLALSSHNAEPPNARVQHSAFKDGLQKQRVTVFSIQ